MTADAPAADSPLHGASPAEAYRRFWQRAVVFTGRAGRAEYWWPVLLNALVVIGLAVVLGAVAATGSGLADAGSAAVAVTNALVGVLVLILVLFVLAQVVPSIAVAVRRLHDVDLSGWLVLLALLPSVGGLILLVLHVLPANAAGGRYDRGPSGALRPHPAAVPAAAPSGPGFDAWPAPATAPVPVGGRDLDGTAVPAAGRVASGLHAAWAALGEVTPVEPPLSAPPAWRRQGWLLVSRPDGTGLLAADGLSGSQGAAALGAGAEVFLAGGSLHAADVAERWELAAVAAVARRVAASGMHLPSELERYGTLSMSLPDVPAPDGLRTADGGLGVLIGLPVAGVPETVATAGGEVRLASVTALTPDELQQILDGGGAARSRVAARLAALPPRELLERA